MFVVFVVFFCKDSIKNLNFALFRFEKRIRGLSFLLEGRVIVCL